MNVLHVAEALSRNFGGVQSVVHDLAKAQQQAGLQVDVVSTNVDEPRGVLSVAANEFIERDGIRFRHSSVQFRPLLISLDLKAYLDRHISLYDIVHVHGLYRFPPTYAAYQARKQGIPFIIEPHGSLDPYLYNKSSRSLLLKRVYERLFDLPNLNAAGAIQYTTEEERERVSFLELSPPTFVVPNGLDWERFSSLPARGALRARWQIDRSPIILFVGRLHPVKGLDLLISAFTAVQERHPETKLVIVSPENNSYGQQVRRWVHERGMDGSVFFVGPLYGSDLVQAYVDADVFALPSYAESFGMAAAEAMACAKPIVISDQVRIHNEVAKADAGLITRCAVEEIAGAMDALLCDVSRRRVMGAAGRQLVRQRYAWPAIVRALVQEYEAVIERHRAAGN